MDEHTEEQVGVQDIPPQPAAPAGRHSRSLIQHQHPQPAARAVPCVPGEPHRDTHKGDLGWSVSTAPLPIPARLAGSESAVSMAELPGRPSIWEEGGERVLHPEGQELRGRSFGRHKG